MKESKTYPYTFDQLRKFKKELKEAGGVEELMIEKEALIRNGEMTIIATLEEEEIEKYKTKYLIGVYGSLQNNFTSKVPYVFWSKVYEMSLRI